MHEVIIKIDNLTKTYQDTPGQAATPVLRGVTATIEATDFAIIYGPSGSGKSTLLHHIVGLETPTSGQVVVRDTPISQLSQEERAVFRAQKFGMVYQLMYWVRSLNVLDNVALPLFINGADRLTARRQAKAALSEAGVLALASKQPIQLSGGEQQRVGLARALVNNPWIVIADEPTGNLDTGNADAVIKLLFDLNRRKKRTVVMVTHNLAYLRYATRLIALRDGRVVSSGAKVKEQIRQELRRAL